MLNGDYEPAKFPQEHPRSRIRLECWTANHRAPRSVATARLPTEIRPRLSRGVRGGCSTSHGWSHPWCHPRYETPRNLWSVKKYHGAMGMGHQGCTNFWDDQAATKKTWVLVLFICHQHSSKNISPKHVHLPFSQKHRWTKYERKRYFQWVFHMSTVGYSRCSPS